MYSENLSFEAAHLRDTFLNAEREYVEYLLQFEEVREIIINLNRNYDPGYLFSEAQKLIDKVDMGEFSDAEMELVEKKLIVLLAAIHDKILIKELIRTYSDDNVRLR